MPEDTSISARVDLIFRTIRGRRHMITKIVNGRADPNPIYLAKDIIRAMCSRCEPGGHALSGQEKYREHRIFNELISLKGRHKYPHGRYSGLTYISGDKLDEFIVAIENKIADCDDCSGAYVCDDFVRPDSEPESDDEAEDELLRPGRLDVSFGPREAINLVSSDDELGPPAKRRRLDIYDFDDEDSSSARSS